jgi:DNA-binding beta-propeller fold protein YncE
MPRRLRGLRLFVAVSAAVTLLSSGALVTVLVTWQHDHATTAAAPAGAADRFLELSGDSGSAAGTAARTEQAGSATRARDCKTDSATVAVMPNGWCIRPAGKNVDVLRFPLGLLPIDNGSKLVVSSSGGGVQGLTVVDTASLQATPTPQANLFMGLAATPDGRVLASGGNANRVFRFRLAGSALASQDATEQATFPLDNGLDGAAGQATGQQPKAPAGDGIAVPGYPGPLASYGKYVFVTGTLSEPAGSQHCPSGRAACGRVSVVDTTNDSVVARVPVGLDAIGLALDAKRKRLYVANWADEAGRGNGRGGTVSVVDISSARPTAWHETSYTRVGHHPSAVQLSRDGKRLFVANTNDDTLSVLDVTRPVAKVLATETVSPVPGVPAGAHPDTFALSPDGKTLFVALAGMNAVEVRDGRTGQRVAGAPVYIPTGWYPSALAITPAPAQHYRLWVANAKGVGPGPGYNGSVFLNGTTLDGSVTSVDLPVTATQQNAWTRQTVANDDIDDASVNPCHASGVRVSQVLCPPKGRKSPIRHVIYIVTENKTFDQYFGDIGGSYRADPSYVLYGQQNTPNHHAIANRYGLGDNFFSDAEVSVTGHSWTSGAIATDHNEKTWEADYDQGVRGTHGNSDPLRGSVGTGAAGGAIQDAEDELNDPEGGYIFEAFKRAGAVPPSRARRGRLSMGIYGEHIARRTGHRLDAYVAKGWKDGDIEYYDTCRAKEFITGKAPDSLAPYESHIGASAPADVATYGCQGRKLAPHFSLKDWIADYKAGKGDTMPSFIYMSLPDNHTLATNIGSPTPQSMVADNDYAIGLIVDALSKSPFWSSTAVMQTEDDTQVAGDHVSSLRDYLMVASPWAQHGPDHQWGSMPALLRTIEQIFAVKPVSLFDRIAMPMHEAFLARLSDKPDLAPYDVRQELVPFALNSADAPFAQLSTNMACWRTYDLCNEALLNKILYAAVKQRPVKR